MIPNPWPKGGLWAKRPPRFLQPPSARSAGLVDLGGILATSGIVEWRRTRSRFPVPVPHRSIPKTGPIRSTGPDLLLRKKYQSLLLFAQAYRSRFSLPVTSRLIYDVFSLGDTCPLEARYLTPSENIACSLIFPDCHVRNKCWLRVLHSQECT